MANIIGSAPDLCSGPRTNTSNGQEPGALNTASNGTSGGHKIPAAPERALLHQLDQQQAQQQSSRARLAALKTQTGKWRRELGIGPKPTSTEANGSSSSNTSTSLGIINGQEDGESNGVKIQSGETRRSRSPTPPSAIESGAGSTQVIVQQQSILQPYMNRYRFLSVCLITLGNGLNDSAPGALIPSMQAHYEIGYATVALIFVGQAVGFIAAAPFIDGVRERLGHSRAILFAQILMAAGYIPLLCTAPFPAIPVSFFLIGLAQSTNLAIANVFCADLQNCTSALGRMHGAYGIGGTVGPLIATSLVNAAGGKEHWNWFYYLGLGLALCDGMFAAWAFWGYDDERKAAEQAEEDAMELRSPATTTTTTTAAPRTQSRRSKGVKGQVKQNLQGMLTAVTTKVVILGAAFIFAYQGAEVSISGWVISFLLEARVPGSDAGPIAESVKTKVGYVTAGFWGGITLGRFLLSGPAMRFGEKRFVYCTVVGAAVFQLLVWFVPNLISNAVSVAIVGLLLGPVYPCAAAVFMRNINRNEQVSAMGVISAFGSSGGAVAPFTTGLLAQLRGGPFVLHPIAIGLFVVMMGCWYFLPNRPPRREE
ncbi:major facilitator superfamily domain-containing protein [Apodospora peruviana]|uniref:Major facilitator superfamily domain-containing protein n=1 Tax=Apodospora peruviana TaxID=516989 RepID=A0AAE0I5T4_9PEZI|nr:major facilitator superfamily domain-containing protein [Apodospora peruviana]